MQVVAKTTNNNCQVGGVGIVGMLRRRRRVVMGLLVSMIVWFSWWQSFRSTSNSNRNTNTKTTTATTTTNDSNHDNARNEIGKGPITTTTTTTTTTSIGKATTDNDDEGYDEEEYGDGNNQQEEEDSQLGMPANRSPSPTFMPTSFPSRPPIVAIVPPPSFNVTMIDSADLIHNGCTLGDNDDNNDNNNAVKVPPDTVKAQFSTKFPPRISMDNLMGIVQAGANFGSDDQELKVVCQLRRLGNYAHFPHVLQQVTRCFSVWQIFKRHKPYLFMYTRQRQHKYDTFNQHVIDLLQNAFGVTVITKNDEAVDENTLLVKPLYDTGMEESLQQGIVFQTPQHAAVFRRTVQAYYNISSTTTNNNNNMNMNTIAGCLPHKQHPVINILNRQRNSSRSIVNVQRLTHYLQQLTTAKVRVVTFENKTFPEQVAFMSQTDIVVSPHGAQLSTLMFLPAPCGGVFEIFPAGYHMPHFFGPLAVTSGLQHAFVYNGASVQDEWYQGSLLDRQARFKARRQNVCVPLATTLDLIGQMVDQWKVCCQEKQGIVMEFD